MVAGYMVEYSGMKFAMFFIAEYVNMFAAAILISTLFLGGWKFFGLEDVAPVLTPIIVFAKAVFVIFCMLWFRATFPRLRFDHLIGFAWKFLVPLSLVNLLLAALVVKLTDNVWGQGRSDAAGQHHPRRRDCLHPQPHGAQGRGCPGPEAHRGGGKVGCP